MKKHFLIFATGLFLLSACNSVKAPEAILPIPEAKQVEWQKWKRMHLYTSDLTHSTTVNGDMETPILKHSTLPVWTVSNGYRHLSNPA